MTMERGEPIQETPELEELQQHEQPALSVPVRHEGPVTAHVLPNRYVQNSTTTVKTSYESVAPATPKRGRGLLISMTEDVYINDRSAGEGTIWPKLVPYEFSHTRPVFVRAVQNTTMIGLTLELWAD